MKKWAICFMVILFPAMVWGQVMILADHGIERRNKADSLVGVADTVLVTINLSNVDFSDSLYIVYRLDTTKIGIFDTVKYRAWADSGTIPRVAMQFKYLLDKGYDLSPVQTKQEADTLAYAGVVNDAWLRLSDSLVSRGKYVWKKFHIDPVATHAQIRFYFYGATSGAGTSRGAAIRWRVLAIKQTGIW